jgi:multiple antibiotic resistance protein
MSNLIINAFFLIYAGLFPIVNPVGSAPIFLGLTQQSTGAERHGLAARVAINGFLLLLGSLFVGSYLLEFFGITIPVVRIGGGFVVAAFGWKLLNEPGALTEHHAQGDAQASEPIDSFYPLTMPLTIGPGSISTAITLGSQRPEVSGDVLNLALVGAGAVAGLIAIATTIYFCYRFADRIVSALGASGTNVFIRLSAFIMLCIGIQIVWNGYSALATRP